MLSVRVPMYEPRLTADSRGVWREDPPGRTHGIEWGEIYMISAMKLDTITRVDIILDLDFEWGGYVELNDEWPGFDQVIVRITEEMPGLPTDWFDRVKLVPVGTTAEIWKRGNLGGGQDGSL